MSIYPNSWDRTRDKSTGLSHALRPHDRGGCVARVDLSSAHATRQDRRVTRGFVNVWTRPQIPASIRRNGRLTQLRRRRPPSYFPLHLSPPLAGAKRPNWAGHGQGVVSEQRFRRRAGQAAAAAEGRAGQARTRSGASWSGHGRARWYGPPPEPVCLKAVILLTGTEIQWLHHMKSRIIIIPLISLHSSSKGGHDRKVKITGT
jgi:hypothetical protein